MSTLSLQALQEQIQQLEAQRAQLQADAEKHRNDSKVAVVQELIERIALYGITAKDLGLIANKASKSKPGRKSLGAKIAQSGKSGKTHTGPEGQTYIEGTRGRKPAWLKEQEAQNADSAA
jgi:DNA-binding protein H-NS